MFLQVVMWEKLLHEASEVLRQSVYGFRCWAKAGTLRQIELQSLPWANEGNIHGRYIVEWIISYSRFDLLV